MKIEIENAVTGSVAVIVYIMCFVGYGPVTGSILIQGILLFWGVSILAGMLDRWQAGWTK